jgi:hypothetical protein
MKNKELWIETSEGSLDDIGPKVVGFSRQRHRWVGCPWALLVDACHLTEDEDRGRATVALVALLIYRRTQVCKSRTVTLPAIELRELGISRFQKTRALGVLQAAGLIAVKKHSGRSPRVTLLWKERRA